MKQLAVYIHVPFCARKCVYCDFASFPGLEDQWDTYFNALREEIEQWKDVLHNREVCSLFFGGGTPSLVPAHYIASVVEQLRKVAVFAPDAEITLEANPGTLTAEKLKVYETEGINRLSIGVQSFDTDLLRSLGRIHTPRQAIDAVCLAREAGFENINIDLMYALPGQGMKQWMETLNTAVKLPIAHISAYSLIVEEGTEMKRRADSGEVVLPDEDMVINMQRFATMFLRENGFKRYEISNYAQSGRESRHNMAYWTDVDYLGFGSAAHSLLDNTRFSNSSDPKAYISGVRKIDSEERTVSDHMEEVLMLSTRTVRGLDIQKWKTVFGSNFEQQFNDPLNKLYAFKFAEVKDGYFTLTERGMEIQDSIVLEMMEEL